MINLSVGVHCGPYLVLKKKGCRKSCSLLKTIHRDHFGFHPCLAVILLVAQPDRAAANMSASIRRYNLNNSIRLSSMYWCPPFLFQRAAQSAARLNCLLAGVDDPEL